LPRLQIINPIPIVCLVLVILPLGFGCSSARNVLIYTRNGPGYVHDNIPASVDCLKHICRQNHWNCTTTDNPAVFTPEILRTFDVLVFSNTNNEAFNTETQRNAFQDYIRSGGGFVGIHSACGSERDWPWFWANLGGKFIRHASHQKISLVVIDANHPSTRHLPAVWDWHEDECYYLDNLNPDIHILLAADLTKIQDDEKNQYPGRVFGDYFPLCWHHQFEGGRQWYTAIGHYPDDYQDENFIKHLTGGIRWAMRK
jgi:uncharacterized protein